MRFYQLICIAGLLSSGCDIQPYRSATAPANASHSNTITDQNAMSLFVGTWDFSFPDGLQNVRIEMQQSGHWKLWIPFGQTPPSPKIVSGAEIQTGSWFIHQRTLFLRIEETSQGHMPPGIAYTFDVSSVSTNAALLTWLDGKREVKWTRVTKGQ